MDKFKECGEDVEIFEPISIIAKNKITLKNKVRLSEFTLISGGSGVYIGNFVHVANHVSIAGGGICILEDFVGICAGTRIITGSDNINGDGIPSPLVPTEYRSFYRSHVVCKQYSFIGTNAILHPGITIGEGAVVASASLVTKDLEPWGVYMGTPARKIRERKKEKVKLFGEKIYDKYQIEPSNFEGII